MQAVPLTIIGVSYSVAAFPTLSRLFAGGKREDFIAQVESALRHIIFWAIPATVLVIVLRAQLVRVILGAGMFDWTATRLTAAALALFILSLLAQSVMLVITRAYYAAGITKKPLLLAALSVAVSVGSALTLLFAFQGSVFMQSFFESILRVEGSGDTAVLMLALGYALGPLFQCLLGVVLFSRDFGLKVFQFARLFVQSCTASILGGAAAYGTLGILSTSLDTYTLLGIFLQGFIAGCAGLVVTGALLFLMKNRELGEIVSALRRRAPESKAVALEPTEIESAT